MEMLVKRIIFKEFFSEEIYCITILGTQMIDLN